MCGGVIRLIREGWVRLPLSAILAFISFVDSLVSVGEVEMTVNTQLSCTARNPHVTSIFLHIQGVKGDTPAKSASRTHLH